MSMALNLQNRQQQTLSPRLQRAVRLLQLSSADFAAEVQNALGDNPFLDADESEEEGAAGDVEREYERGTEDAFESESARDDAVELSLMSAATPHEVTEISSAEDFDGDDANGERESWQSDFYAGAQHGQQSDISAMDMQAQHISLTNHLHGQLNVLPLGARDRMLAQAIIESLDDDGYLRCEWEDIAACVELNPAATAEEIDIALKRVQAMEPRGVAARNVAECLMLQLPSIDCEETRTLACKIIADHLERLAARDIDGLAKKLNMQPSRIEAVCDRIRQFNPRPGGEFSDTCAPYVVPDVVVKKVRGVWVATLNTAVVPKVRLNHVYAEMLQRNRSTANAELSTHLQEARWTVSNVEQRFATILSVAQAIVNRQSHFLDFGPMAMKPLGLREIAEETGMHESTVSRVTNNKFMATPLGVYELKYFFSRTMHTASGSACSATAIRSLIKDMIAVERPDAPMSDAEIARQLGKQGLVVARRTVTKYRQQLRIEAVERRRRH